MDVLITLDTRRAKKDKSYPILLRISSGTTEKTLPVQTGYSAPKSFWDEKKREIKKGYQGYQSISRINNLINSKRNAARAVVTRLEEAGTLSNLPMKDVKARIVSAFRKPDALSLIDQLRAEKIIASDKKKEDMIAHVEAIVLSGDLAAIPTKDLRVYLTEQIKTGSVFSFLKELVAELREMDKVGTADAYRDVYGVLKNFWGKDKDLDFNQLDVKFLNDLEKWHLKKGLMLNGLAAYLRSLRATYNKAVKAGIADKDANPFLDYSIKTEPTAKRAISEKYLLNIINLKLEQDDPQFNARSYFLASFAMQGMSFVDMAFLTKDKIFDGRVKYRRAKTSRMYNIVCNPLLDGILAHYGQEKSDEDFIFPILKRTTVADRYKDMRQARKKYNKSLKVIAEKCGIQDNLTSYVARHSFAMAARMNDVPIEDIADMLGHNDLKTTQIYLQSIPQNRIDKHMDKIMGFAGNA